MHFFPRCFAVALSLGTLASCGGDDAAPALLGASGSAGTAATGGSSGQTGSDAGRGGSSTAGSGGAGPAGGGGGAGAAAGGAAGAGGGVVGGGTAGQAGGGGSPMAGSSGSGQAGSGGSGQAGAAGAGEGGAAGGKQTIGTFTKGGSAKEACPLSKAGCADWPAAADGTVFRYTSTETFRGVTRERSFHVFVPTAVTSPAPVVVVLHGGFGSGLRILADSGWTGLALAKQAGITWRKNTDACKALPTSEANGKTPVFRTSANAACTPPEVSYANAKPFVVVYPDGVKDLQGAFAHWEDGRLPSPGFDTPEENRDDVGFVDHIFDVLFADAALPIDSQAAYLAGLSNGGMMTQRIAAQAGNPSYPRLATIAAYAAFVSDFPEPLALPSVPGAFGLVLFHGNGIAMPDCAPFGQCTTPTVLGDDRMPFGETGGVHFVNSPDGGRVRSGPDTIAAWRLALGAQADGTTEQIGFSRRTVYPSLPAALQSWVTDGGGHGFLSGRQDIAPVARAWAFLSSFQREPSGKLVRLQPSWLSGTF